MTTATDRTETSEDFESTKTFSAPPEKVLAALRSVEGITDWWGPTTGSAQMGGTFEVSFQDHKQVIVLHVEATEEGRVVWTVKETPLTPEWVGTTIVFDLAAAGDAADTAFPPPRPHPAARVLRHVPRRLDALPGQPGLLRGHGRGAAQPERRGLIRGVEAGSSLVSARATRMAA